MHFSFGLIAVLVLLAVVITVLMRPDIFSSTLRGESHKQPKRSVLTDKEFQDRLNAAPDDTKENNNG